MNLCLLIVSAREVALRNSPSKLVSQLQSSSSSCHVVVAVAQNDSPEFRKQSEEYYQVSGSDVNIDPVWPSALLFLLLHFAFSFDETYVSVYVDPFQTLKTSGLTVSLEDVPGTDHFSVIENLVDGEYQLTKVRCQHTHVKQQQNKAKYAWMSEIFSDIPNNCFFF